MTGPTTYAVVTPARNEAGNLVRLAECLDRQTFAPQAWVIVDNGSTDDTPAVAEQLAESRPWVRVTHAAGAGASVRGGPVARAFHAGWAVLPCEPDVIVKVDADVSFDDDFFVRLVGASQTPASGSPAARATSSRMGSGRSDM
jgi:glycosyltransferase involved in cell wall biosynthesis